MERCFQIGRDKIGIFALGGDGVGRDRRPQGDLGGRFLDPAANPASSLVLPKLCAFLFFREGSCDLERLSNLLEVTQRNRTSKLGLVPRVKQSVARVEAGGVQPGELLTGGSR